MQETLFRFPWKRDRLPTPVFLGFPCDSAGKESPAMWETWVRSLGWEDPLEKGKATHSSIQVWRIHGVAKSQTPPSDSHSLHLLHHLERAPENSFSLGSFHICWISVQQPTDGPLWCAEHWDRWWVYKGIYMIPSLRGSDSRGKRGGAVAQRHGRHLWGQH